MKTLFYVGMGLQLFGLTAVGLCFFTGVQNGDYGRIELAQFVLGMSVFALGNYLRNRSAS